MARAFLSVGVTFFQLSCCGDGCLVSLWWYGSLRERSLVQLVKGQGNQRGVEGNYN